MSVATLDHFALPGDRNHAGGWHPYLDYRDPCVPADAMSYARGKMKV
jgi:hypothetical protein